MPKLFTAIWLGVSLVFGSVTFASDLSDGLADYKRGDYTSAFRAFTVAAGQGNPEAQYNLALMYQLGQSVNQDDKMALLWYSKAAEQG